MLRRSQAGRVVTNLEVPTINPFINKTAKLDTFGKIKFILALITIVPIKIILILILAIPITLSAKIATRGLSTDDLTKPLPKDRTKYITIISYLVRVVLFVMGMFWIKTKGKPSDKAQIIVPNHMSFLDPAYFMYAVAPHFVAKSASASVPLIGSVIIAHQTILVDRLDPSSRESTAAEITRRAKWTSEPAWRKTVIFPEGTCTNGSAIISFKSGAFGPGMPVQPVIIKYPYVNLDVSYVNGIEAGMLFLRVLSQLVIYMEVEYLPVYIPNEQEKKNPMLFANNVRTAMARALNVITTDHSYEDVMLQVEALKRNLPASQVMLFRSLKKQFSDAKFDDLKRQLTEFAKMDKDKSGTLTIDEFAAALGLPVNALVRELFSILDTDESGEIDFREYITGMALISEQLSDEETLRVAFASFANEDGVINEERLGQVMRRAFEGISDEEISNFFQSIDRKIRDKISFEEFHSHLKKHPEYYSLISISKQKTAEEKKLE